MQSEFRVGCFDADWEEDGITLSHDNGGEITDLDFEDIGDLQTIAYVLEIREKYKHNPDTFEEPLEQLIRDLEA